MASQPNMHYHFNTCYPCGWNSVLNKCSKTTALSQTQSSGQTRRRRHRVAEKPGTDCYPGSKNLLFLNPTSKSFAVFMSQGWSRKRKTITGKRGTSLICTITTPTITLNSRWHSWEIVLQHGNRGNQTSNHVCRLTDDMSQEWSWKRISITRKRGTSLWSAP